MATFPASDLQALVTDVENIATSAADAFVHIGNLWGWIQSSLPVMGVMASAPKHACPPASEALKTVKAAISENADGKQLKGISGDFLAAVLALIQMLISRFFPPAPAPTPAP